MNKPLKNITLSKHIQYMLCCICFVLGPTVSAQKVEPEHMHIFTMVASRDYEDAKKAINLTGEKDIETDFITIRNKPFPNRIMPLFAWTLVPVVVAEATLPTNRHHRVTLLEFAISEGEDSPEKRDFIEFLLKEGTNVNKHHDPYTPITLAVELGYTETVKLLYTYGADPNAGYPGKRAIDLAIAKNNKELVRFFLKEKIVFTDAYSGQGYMAAAIASGNLEMMDMIIGTKLTYGNSASLIHKACMLIHALQQQIDNSTFEKTVEKLIADGFQPNITDSSANLPLHNALLNDVSGLAAVLVDYTNTLNQRNDNGETPLMIAAKNGDRTTVDKLLNRGADISLKNKQGKTAQLIAQEMNHSSLADLLGSNDELLKTQETSADLPVNEWPKTIFLQKDAAGWYYANKQGDNIFHFKADSLTPFHSSGYALIKLNDKWNVVDQRGNFIIEKCDSISSFETPNKNNMQQVFVRTFKNGYWSMQCLSNTFLWALKPFNQLTAFQFKDRKDNHFALYREDFQYGFIDTDGNPVNEKYDTLLQDTKGDIWGTIDGKKKRIKLQGSIPAEFIPYKTR